MRSAGSTPNGGMAQLRAEQWISLKWNYLILDFEDQRFLADTHASINVEWWISFEQRGGSN